MANLYVQAAPPTDLNRNTEWFTYPDVWITYILILFFAWLAVLSVFGCSPGMAWTIVNLSHAVVKPEEIAAILNNFNEPSSFAPIGLYLGGTKCLVIKDEVGPVIQGKKRTQPWKLPTENQPR